MKKIALFFFLVLLTAAAAGGYFYSQKNKIITEKISQGLQVLTGAPSEMTGVVITPGKALSGWKLKIEKIVIRNQGTFRIDKLAILEDVEMEFDPLPLLSGKWKIHSLSVYLYRGYFQVNSKGVLNVSELPAIKMLAAANTAVPAGDFYAGRVELKYGKFYYINDQSSPAEKKTHTLEAKADVYMNVNNPNLLVQAPVFTYLSQMNLGSFGLPRGKLQESIKQYVGQ